MIIFVLDLIDGIVVCFYQGDYGQQCDYGSDLLLCLQFYVVQGVEVLYLVDLIGVKDLVKC